MNDLFFSMKHLKEDRFIAFFFSNKIRTGYLIRAAKYKERWFFERIYQTTSTNYTKIEFLKDTLMDVNYFESRYSTKLNHEFWDDNWRMYELVKPGNTFEFVNIQLIEGEL